MGKTQEDILKEIMAELSAIRSSLGAVEERLAQLNIVEPQQIASSAPEIVSVAVQEPAPSPVAQEAPVAVQELAPSPVAQEAPVAVQEPAPSPVAQEAPVAVQESAPSPVAQETPVAVQESRPVDLNELHMANRKKGLGETMTEAQAWRSALPGTAVKDIRNAISLNDRLLFTRELFNGDEELFQSTMDGINSSCDFDRVADTLLESYPQWDADSDIVYRFMMAVRRRLSAE